MSNGRTISRHENRIRILENEISALKNSVRNLANIVSRIRKRKQPE